ncbi:rho gtpase-activating protein hypothetical protein [Limosa lapponica baueri]|uniref:Rho-GAP domain-containing protein n=1 Tax=Limosa lapponica baueri TaxID=1758121 RepID=A0A2I0TV35_LIMLA|nr:rho gtpase-activating protein hypothetical protein [Limosa lapponica baueri]
MQPVPSSKPISISGLLLDGIATSSPELCCGLLEEDPIPWRIAAKESVNLMSTQSLGIVFGPTLLRPEKETGNMAVHMLYQNQIVELMLSEYSKIFGSEED